MKVMQIIYSSRPINYNKESLNRILAGARKNNNSENITGFLIHRKDLFVQILEGPRFGVSNTFARILQDKRHHEVAILHAGDASARLFADWDMKDDKPRNWMWSMADVQAGVTAHATADEAVAVFTRLANEVNA